MADPQPLSDALSITLPDEAATRALARKLAAQAVPGDVIALTGELGAGKTSFARAFVNALPGPDGAPSDEEVPSPTFTLVQVYERRPATVWHFDLYRVAEPGEIEELGWQEALAGGIVLVEWPDRLDRLLPAGRLDITLTFPAAGEGRVAVLQGGPAWHDRLEALSRDA